MSTISNERLEKMAAGGGFNFNEVEAISSELLALRKERERAEPVAEVYAELYRLRKEVKGPDGFATWKDAALAEKVSRVKCEALVNKRSCDIDYLTAMAAFHSDDWHKMGPITAYMHGWNARKACAVDSSIERDARRYRFLRDKDAFGDDAEPGLVSWGELTELDLCEFDAALDARLAAAGFETLYTAPPAAAHVDEIAAQAGIDPAVADAYMQGCHDTEARKAETDTTAQQFESLAGKAVGEDASSMADAHMAWLNTNFPRNAYSDEEWEEVSLYTWLAWRDSQRNACFPGT